MLYVLKMFFFSGVMEIFRRGGIWVTLKCWKINFGNNFLNFFNKVKIKVKKLRFEPQNLSHPLYSHPFSLLIPQKLNERSIMSNQP
jgi:hypothetical protein